MKTRYLLAATALLVTSACNGETSTGSGNATERNVTAAVVPPPSGGDWTQTVSKTPAGGFVMGNPNAAVKLVEYGSMTCPHCAEFDEVGVQPLIDKYVKTGQVSFEFRNFVRDPYDLAASLIARCNGEKGFFALTRELYENQHDWIERLQAVPQQQQQALQTLGPDRQFLEIAKLAGLQQWAAMRGVPTAKSTQCLTSQDEVTKLVQMNSDATSNHPDFQGTPSFTINGKLLDRTASWETLEPQLREALGG